MARSNSADDFKENGRIPIGQSWRKEAIRKRDNNPSSVISVPGKSTYYYAKDHHVFNGFILMLIVCIGLISFSLLCFFPIQTSTDKFSPPARTPIHVQLFYQSSESKRQTLNFETSQSKAVNKKIRLKLVLKLTWKNV